MPNQSDPQAPGHPASSALIEVLKALPGGALAGTVSSWLLARRKSRLDSVIGIRDLRGDLAAELHCYWSRDQRQPEIEVNVVRLNKRFHSKINDHVKKYGTVRGKHESTFRADLLHLNVQLTASPFGTEPWQKSPHISTALDQRLDDILGFID